MNTAEKQQAIDTPYQVTKAQQEKELQEAATAIRAAERPTGRYSILDATVLLLAETGESIKLRRAVEAGEIKSYAPGREVHIVRPAHAYVLDSDELYQDDINAWLDSNYPRLSFRFGTKQPPAKVGTGDTANESEQPASAPAIEMEKQGIDKREIARAFAGMHFNYDKWLKYLATPPDWLKKCRLKMGSKSASAKWSPVLIAVELLGKGKTPRQLDAVFVDLKDWVDEWREITEVMR